MNGKICVFRGEKHEEVFIRVIQYKGEILPDTKYGYDFIKNDIEPVLVPGDFGYVYEAAEDGKPSGRVISTDEWLRREKELNGES